MGMKQATKDRLERVFDSGYRMGEQAGYERAMKESSLLAQAQSEQDRARTAFLAQLDAEPETE